MSATSSASKASSGSLYGSGSTSGSVAGDCRKDLVTAFEYSFGECSNASGIRTVLGIVQPTNETQRALICNTAMCTDLYRLFRNNANEHCTVGSLIELSPSSVARVLANCATPTSPPTPATPTPTTAETPTPTTEYIDTTSSSSNTGGIIGGVVGGIVLVVLLLLLLRWRKRCQRGKHPNANTNGTANGTQSSGLLTKQGDVYMTMPLSPRTEPSESTPWGDPAITAIRIPLEKLRFGALLSQGAYGEVYRGTYNEQDVAIKKILPVRRRDLTQIHLFLDEIKLTASLDHACIVRFVGVAWDSLADLCMVSEFMPGGDLRELLKQYASEHRPLGFDYSKLQIAVHVAHALTYLHSLQPALVHRDLKSRNILLTETLDAKLIDFGVSRERHEMTMTAGVGTSRWMAPEVMLGERYDQKADVFSFGVVLSELDTHDVPYGQMRASGSDRKMTDMVLMQLVSQGQLGVEFSEQADATVVTLARDCLQLDPLARPTSAEVLHRIHTIWRATGHD